MLFCGEEVHHPSVQHGVVPLCAFNQLLAGCVRLRALLLGLAWDVELVCRQRHSAQFERQSLGHIYAHLIDLLHDCGHLLGSSILQTPLTARHLQVLHVLLDPSVVTQMVVEFSFPMSIFLIEDLRFCLKRLCICLDSVDSAQQLRLPHV